MLVQRGQRVQKVGPDIVLVAVFRLVKQHDFRREDGPSARAVWEGVLKAQPNRWVAAEEQVIAVVFIEKHFQKTRIMPGVAAPQGMDRQGEGRSVPAGECAFVGCFEAPASRVQVAVERPLVPPQYGEVYVFMRSGGPGEEQVDSPRRNPSGRESRP